MKNLFKNLMLVAVAAMASVACSQEGIEVNNLTKKTIVEGIASINTDDTRSGFVGSETDENGNTVYKSAWYGDENIKVFATEQGLETTAKINEDGKFTAEFDGELPEKYFIAVCSPAEAWVSAYTCNIPTVQTPRTDSVDPAAHILSQQGIYVSNGSADPFIMQHQVGYGKMTVNTPAEFVIDYVEVELNGVWYGSAKNLKYTINADNVEGNVFWFATDVVEVSDFTVTAYDAEGNAYTKSVTIPEDRELNFNYGSVSTFSVSNLEKYVAPDTVMDSATYYFNYNNLGSYSNWGYIVFEDATLGTLVLNVYLPNGLYFDVKTYIANAGLDIGLSRYAVTGGSLKGLDYNYYNNMIVTVVDGKYNLTLDFKNTDGDILNATYVGDIVDFGYPDLRTKLPTPEVTTTISGKTITMNWNAVENAESYYITCTSDQDFEPISTTDTTVTITVSTYEYHSFSIKAVVSDDNEIYRSSDEAYVEYNDPREELPSPSNVTATIDGPNATISWDAVDGADSYQVSYWLNEQKRIDVADTSITLEVGYDVSDLWVYVFSIADDDNLEYRSSNSWDASVKVNTGKDPNVFADHILDKVTVKSDYIEFYREYVGDGTQHTANTTESLRIYLHANNRGNNYISTGEYTCVGSGASVPPSAGTVNMRYNADTYWGYHSNANTNSTLSVSFVNNEYVIIATINGETWGYKGMPDGWDAPETGGEEPGEGGGEEPGEGGGDEPDGTVNNPYVFTNCTYAPGQYVQLHFSGSEDGAELTLESNTGYGLPEGVVSLSNNGWWPSGHSYSLGDINFSSSYTSIDRNTDGSYKINYIMINSNGKNTYYTYNENIL